MTTKHPNTPILFTIVAIIAILAAVILLAKDPTATVAFIGVVSPTIIALLNYLKINQVQTEVAKITNGHLMLSVEKAIDKVVGPVIDEVNSVAREENLPQRAT